MVQGGHRKIMIARANEPIDDLRAALRAYECWAPDLKRRTLQRMRHDVNRALRVWGDVEPRDVTTEHFQAVRRQVIDSELSVATIEGTISTILTLLRFLQEIGELSKIPSKGRVLRRPAPSIVMPEIEELSAVYNAAECCMWPRLCRNRPNWWRALIATHYFTALRLSDVLALTWDSIKADRITLVAEKTGKTQHIPIHPVLAKHLSWIPRVNDRIFFSAKKSLKQLRREMHRMSKTAGVNGVTSQQIRKLSANEWERAGHGCGSLILGHGLRGATRYYLEMSRPLFEAVHKLRVPEGMAEDFRDDGQLRLFG